MDPPRTLAGLSALRARSAPPLTTPAADDFLLSAYGAGVGGKVSKKIVARVVRPGDASHARHPHFLSCGLVVGARVRCLAGDLDHGDEWVWCTATGTKASGWVQLECLEAGAFGPQHKDALQRLPGDLLMNHVVPYLGYRDILALQCASRGWRCAMDSERAFKGILGGLSFSDDPPWTLPRVLLPKDPPKWHLMVHNLRKSTSLHTLEAWDPCTRGKLSVTVPAHCSEHTFQHAWKKVAGGRRLEAFYVAADMLRCGELQVCRRYSIAELSARGQPGCRLGFKVVAVPADSVVCGSCFGWGAALEEDVCHYYLESRAVYAVEETGGLNGDLQGQFLYSDGSATGRREHVALDSLVDAVHVQALMERWRAAGLHWVFVDRRAGTWGRMLAMTQQGFKRYASTPDLCAIAHPRRVLEQSSRSVTFRPTGALKAPTKSLFPCRRVAPWTRERGGLRRELMTVTHRRRRASWLWRASPVGRCLRTCSSCLARALPWYSARYLAHPASTVLSLSSLTSVKQNQDVKALAAALDAREGKPHELWGWVMQQDAVDMRLIRNVRNHTMGPLEARTAAQALVNYIEHMQQQPGDDMPGGLHFLVRGWTTSYETHTRVYDSAKARWVDRRVTHHTTIYAAQLFALSFTPGGIGALRAQCAELEGAQDGEQQELAQVRPVLEAGQVDIGKSEGVLKRTLRKLSLRRRGGP